MTRNAASTSRHEADDRAGAGSFDPVDQAAWLAERAEEILAGYLKPGRWPTARVAQRFLQSGDLERVLSLYAGAMESDPLEPAYAWNLASSLDRLRLANLALTFIRRAIRVAEETGDLEWAGADAHLAWADIAIRAGEPETAKIAIERARMIDPQAPFERYLRRLRREPARPDERKIMSNQDSARKGAAVEHLIAASLMLESGFELNVSTNLVDDEGVDLVFHRRRDSTMLAVQIKSRSWSASVMRDSAKFITNVRRTTFHPRRDLFLLFVAIEPSFADFGPLWLIPSLDFADILASSGASKLRFAASASPASSDRWTPYRLERSQLTGRLLDALIDLNMAED